MDPRPSDQELAAAVGAAGKKVKRLRGGPFLWQFEVDGRAREVLVLDGKVAPKSLASVGRYLKAVGMLDKKQMTLNELLGLLDAHGELPAGFDFLTAMNRRGPTEGPALRYHDGGATLTVYADEPLPPSTHAPGAPMPANMPRGASVPRWLRATLQIPASYELSWTVERFVGAPADRWEPR